MDRICPLGTFYNVITDVADSVFDLVFMAREFCKLDEFLWVVIIVFPSALGGSRSQIGSSLLGTHLKTTVNVSCSPKSLQSNRLFALDFPLRFKALIDKFVQNVSLLEDMLFFLSNQTNIQCKSSFQLASTNLPYFF